MGAGTFASALVLTEYYYFHELSKSLLNEDSLLVV